MKLLSILLALRVLSLGAFVSGVGAARSEPIKDRKVAVRETSGLSRTVLKAADRFPGDSESRPDLGDFAVEGDDDSEDEKKYSSLLLESSARVAPLVFKYVGYPARSLELAPSQDRSIPLLM